MACVRVRVVIRVMYSFGVMVRVMVNIKIKVYVKPFCLAAKPKSRDNFWASELVTINGNNTKPKRRKINCQIQANSKL